MCLDADGDGESIAEATEYFTVRQAAPSAPPVVELLVSAALSTLLVCRKRCWPIQDYASQVQSSHPVDRRRSLAEHLLVLP